MTRNDENAPPVFSANSGLVDPPPADAEAEYFLNLFLPQHVFEHLVTKANRYAEQYLAANPKLPQHSLAKAWKPVTLQDMKRLIAL